MERHIMEDDYANLCIKEQRLDKDALTNCSNFRRDTGSVSRALKCTKEGCG